MPLCFFVSDLHGKIDRYQKLNTAILQEKPAAVFFGGDLLPPGPISHKNYKPITNFILDFLTPEYTKLKSQMSDRYPRIFLILGNDDGKNEEGQVINRWGAYSFYDVLHDLKLVPPIWELSKYFP